MSDRKKYTPQFKADAVALVLSSGRPVAQVAPEIGVWVRVWKEEHPEAGKETRARWSGLSTKPCSSSSLN